MPNLPEQHTSSISGDKQIFIHPEHEKGTLLNKATGKPNLFYLLTKRIFLLGFVLALLLIILGTVSLVIPMSKTASFASKTKEVVSDSSAGLEKVNLALDVLYKSLTQTQESDVSFSSVALQNSTFKDYLFENAKSLMEGAKTFSVSDKVRSLIIPDDDPNRDIRIQRGLAVDVNNKIEQTVPNREDFTKLIESPISGAANNFKNQVSILKERAEKYYREAGKTANYYITLSDSSIELTNLASSTLTIKDVDKTISELSSLRDKFALYDQNKLPEEIEKYNEDIVEVFDLLVNFYRSLKKEGLKSNEFFLNSYNNFLLGLQSVAGRAESDQISFWQNNPSFSGYENLLDSHTQTLKESGKIWEANKIFLLDWVGIKLN